ncbi:hypothetical protein N0V93_000985 [Gnomoniopsis smithogilvyi]|uniref:Copper amine oxidase catalytic domain-containing protein n=1 Tax=Gnomoniopsis smithogilvyi TaxID=1191159 RepID=A0A9W8Z2W1_9PEZI|nr:hypothetical protein N0V93_000985 [Gnomoniopsis smithogilvyi]
MKVIRIDRLPTTPVEVLIDDEVASKRTRQRDPNTEHTSDLRPKLGSDQKLIITSKAEAISLGSLIEEEVVEWQKWRFYVDFVWRERMAFCGITYDGRYAFYRLSLAETTVPYVEPRLPYHGKPPTTLDSVARAMLQTTWSLIETVLAAFGASMDGRPRRQRSTRTCEPQASYHSLQPTVDVAHDIMYGSMVSPGRWLLFTITYSVCVSPLPSMAKDDEGAIKGGG